jgi:hypothetical protein
MIHVLQWPLLISGPLIVLVVVGLSLAGLILVRRRADQAVLRNSNDVVEAIYQMMGVLYAVLLAFIVVVAWEQFSTAETHTESEAGAVADLYRDAGAFPTQVRDELQSHLLDYARDVIENEWPMMARGDSVELESQAFRVLWRGYLAVHPSDNFETDFHNESIKRLNELGNTRRLRILSSEAELPTVLWILLIGGGILCIVTCYLFGTENRRVHILAVTFLSGLLGFVLFLIFSLEHPYIGRLSVSPEPFRHVLELAEQGQLTDVPASPRAPSGG